MEFIAKLSLIFIVLPLYCTYYVLLPFCGE